MAHDHTPRSLRILVTGGAGFIGSALSKRLVAAGHTVVIVDNFNEYYDPQLKRARQEALLQGIEVREGSICDEAFIREVFATGNFDVVAHLAAQAGVRYSLDHPDVYVETNVRGTQLLLETMRSFGVKRMVFASSSSVYGNSTAAPFREDHAAAEPVSIYAATKRAGELMAYTYASLYDLEVTCARFFTVYGPWSRPDMAMLTFAHRMTSGEPIDIYNHGDLRRDFTYIDDIVDGLVAAVETPLGYTIINMGSGRPVSLLTFIEVLERELGIEAKKNLLPMQDGDVFETYADTSKAKELLGIESKVTFEEGIARFAEWYKQYYH